MYFPNSGPTALRSMDLTNHMNFYVYLAIKGPVI